LKNLSPQYLRQYRVCPVSIDGNTLTVATADPTNLLLLDDLRLSLAMQIKVAVAARKGSSRRSNGRTRGRHALQRIVEGMEDSGAPGEGDEDVSHLRDMAFEAPVVRLVNLVIENALGAEASDIHLEPYEDALRVRYRIDGVLYDQEAPPRRLQAAVTSRIKIMAEMNIAERRLPQDGRIRWCCIAAASTSASPRSDRLR